MQPYDLHVHTVFSDGKNTPEEMISTAIDLGFEKIGISDHSYTFYDPTYYCLPKEKIEEYKAEILSLKQKYRDKIEVLLGIEQDFYADTPLDGYDYAIGSVHYLCKDGNYFPVDESIEDTNNAIHKYFGGDALSYAEEYFRTVAGFVNRDDIKIIGHFDIVTKFNEKTGIIDTKNPRYVAAWTAAADKLIKAGKVFEINYRSMLYGHISQPYPAKEIIEYLTKNGVEFIKSSDSHSIEELRKSHALYF
ncbi:MAG: histidinol-phosphatase HisJ family protein [Oscillospiraceae bacterium]|nr:histidinol-phosphatase HisJ family protein [Candidatus Equicaccousia limihippi]